jgi:import inner membrane translocase subunit TIM54
MKDFIPSRKTAGFLALAATPFAMYMYDRRCAEQIMEEYKAKVRALAEAPMPDSGDIKKDELLFPRKVWVMSSRVPDDSENDRGNRWFKNYIQVSLIKASKQACSS